ncbi:uncharacterized protein LOC110414252 [Herrania umbratica]|uniref:Uncharacterized protein LOC110414252 n=1 Tax=Herrania umbratica TaxID=108875 RepID=A0A6J1A2M7_9ROSI|nr:uncharacterized protein LOC110414252 [Herrania umbratica]XP_021281015.1 uncharacterized protein LOC110414252 [Herrania umbratica]XP_021281016.1 uncharacterized protein LOC110414252 [Herrania umbratica]
MVNTDQEIDPLIDENNHQPQDLAIEITEEDFELAPECCIYKVPSCFREANQKAYTSQLIPIGPIHHGNKILARMERQKQRYYNKFCQRTSKKTLEEFASFIKAHVGILINGMRSTAAVANMINNRRTGVASLTSGYDEIAKDLNEYYDNSWNRTMATLKLVAAFIVVVLTLTQTVLAILK